MSEKVKCGIEDLLSLFEDTLEPSDVLAAKLMSQISNTIAKERLKMRMNQKDFAKLMASSQALVSRWECGDCNFTIKKIAEISSKLNLDVNISFSDPAIQNISDGFVSCCGFSAAKTIVYSTNQFSSCNNSSYGNLSNLRKEDSDYVTIHK